MKHLKKQLHKLRKVEKSRYHPLIHRIHKKYKISTRTLHYVKSYGKHSDITKTIIKQSIWILIFASLVSSFGGLFLENIKELFVVIVPLVILMPTLNDMIGDYGMIISSRFTTFLYRGKINKKIDKNFKLKELFFKIISIALLTSVLSIIISLIISKFSGYNASLSTMFKIFVIVIIDVILLVIILFLVAFFGGLYVYKRNKDPDNFLIPITTSIADFGNMVVLTLLVVLFF